MDAQILYIEDEESLAQLLSLQLSNFNYKVDLAFDGKEAKQKILEGTYQIILLDWMLPECSGLEVLKWLRALDSSKAKTPVIFVTALNSADHIVEGLESGADDYLTKPFQERVLVSRIKSVLRRSQQENSEESSLTSTGWIQFENLSVNFEIFEARLNNLKLPLTRSEFILLESLIKASGRVLTRAQLIKNVQGDGVNVTGRTVDTHIFGLRKKLDNMSGIIDTIRGVGYRFVYPLTD